MNLEELKNEWSRDSVIDELELGTAAIAGSVLHSKYLSELINYKLKLTKVQLELAKLEATKAKWFRGELTSAELAELKWEQHQLRTLKGDIPALIQAEPDVQIFLAREQYIKTFIYFLESVLGEIKNRNFAIRAAVDFARMRAGN